MKGRTEVQGSSDFACSDGNGILKHKRRSRREPSLGNGDYSTLECVSRDQGARCVRKTPDLEGASAVCEVILTRHPVSGHPSSFELETHLRRDQDSRALGCPWSSRFRSVAFLERCGAAYVRGVTSTFQRIFIGTSRIYYLQILTSYIARRTHEHQPCWSRAPFRTTARLFTPAAVVSQSLTELNQEQSRYHRMYLSSSTQSQIQPV